MQIAHFARPGKDVGGGRQPGSREAKRAVVRTVTWAELAVGLVLPQGLMGFKVCWGWKLKDPWLIPELWSDKQAVKSSVASQAWVHRRVTSRLTYLRTSL